ncbi:MAG: TonB-dependent receptor plug domain-containing protein, partial [Fidelibacterota bacterium]
MFVLVLSAWVSVGWGENRISGVVVESATKEPVAGANIAVLGTEQGTVTNREGRFSLTWSEDFPVTLRISYIGYATQEIEVNGPGDIEVTLVPEVLKGKEVTVIGEWSRSQAEASVAMDVIEIEAIELQGSREVGSALRRISSVVVDQSSSGSQTVSIRGSNPNEVAVFLDGVKINYASSGVADLSAIDLNSIQKIEVLRGGSAYLFGQGNLGGVVNLESKAVTRKSISVNWGDGLSFEDDLDLSVGGTGLLGPVGFGGRFSGRSRAYAGRTLTSTAFNTLFSDVKAPWGKINGRWYQLIDSLTFPSGSVARGDHQTITSVRYRGDIWRTTGWEFFAGQRLWTETNNFFDNLDQNLDDVDVSYRIGKAI